MEVRHNWTTEEILEIYNGPFTQLVFDAAETKKAFFDPSKVQLSQLISVKTGGCPEDCAYCPQAARYSTDIDNHNLLDIDTVKEKAAKAKAEGASRVCLGAAWRNVKDGEDFENVLEMVRHINKMEMEVCCTLGMLTEHQAKRLGEAGLYAYNHNLDTSSEYYKEIISTRAYDDRLKTIDNVRRANISVCSGGIIGMGETIEDRADMLKTLANLEHHPESIPVNALVPVAGTPLETESSADIFEVVRMIAAARIVFPKSFVRLSAGRLAMSKEGQALCFLAGANSIFMGDKLLTTGNPDANDDIDLLNQLGLSPCEPYDQMKKPVTVEQEDSELIALGEKPRWTRPNN